MIDRPFAERTLVSQYNPYNQSDVEEILYRTGFIGDDLTEKDMFIDPHLFSYLFARHYLTTEPQHCFVCWVDKKAAGYILASSDSERQIKHYMQSVYPLALRRLETIKHANTRLLAKRALEGYRRLSLSRIPNPIYRDYPAHLHMNVLHEYQRQGIGSQLLLCLLERLEMEGVKGIHLVTANHNNKAVRFYRKHGFHLLLEKAGNFWPGVSNCVGMTFAKRLSP